MLEIHDLHCYYGRSHVVQGVSLAVGAGEAVGLVGRNGVGKTTTLRSIMGLVRGTRGKILFKNEDLSSVPTHARARRGLGFIPDEHAVFPGMTVEENIRAATLLLAGAGQRRSLDTVYELLPLLAERRHQPAGTLSGGEQKMLALARGLASRPELLLIDEPSEGLMPLNAELIANAIDRARSNGLSLLVVDSSFELLRTVCGRLYVMDQGTITGEHRLTELASSTDLVQTYLRANA